MTIEGPPQTMGTRCPHGKDTSHGGLGRALCDAGIEGAKYLRDKEARLRASGPYREDDDRG